MNLHIRATSFTFFFFFINCYNLFLFYISFTINGFLYNKLLAYFLQIIFFLMYFYTTPCLGFMHKSILCMSQLEFNREYEDYYCPPKNVLLLFCNGDHLMPWYLV